MEVRIQIQNRKYEQHRKRAGWSTVFSHIGGVRAPRAPWLWQWLIGLSPDHMRKSRHRSSKRIRCPRIGGFSAGHVPRWATVFKLSDYLRWQEMAPPYPIMPLPQCPAYAVDEERNVFLVDDRAADQAVSEERRD